MQGRERAWWLGFAVFAGLYLTLAIGPWVSDGFRYQLITSHWLVQLRNAMYESNIPILLAEKQEIEAELVKLGPVTLRLQYDPVVASLRMNLQAIQAQLNANRTAGLRDDPFQRIGHALFALLAGLVGGTIGVWFWGRRERGLRPSDSPG